MVVFFINVIYSNPALHLRAVFKNSVDTSIGKMFGYSTIVRNSRKNVDVFLRVADCVSTLERKKESIKLRKKNNMTGLEDDDIFTLIRRGQGCSFNNDVSKTFTLPVAC